MIILYSVSCEGCTGNQALSKVKQVCKKQDLEFQERRTLFWKNWEREANEIIKINGVKLPFFYNTENNTTLEGNSLTPLETITNWINQKGTK